MLPRPPHARLGRSAPRLCGVQCKLWGWGGGIPRGDGIKDKHGGDDSLDAVKEADRGSSLPSHVAIIMDGNRRFAASKRMPTVYGHKKGKEVLEKVMHTRPTPRQNL